MAKKSLRLSWVWVWELDEDGERVGLALEPEIRTHREDDVLRTELAREINLPADRMQIVQMRWSADF